MIFSYPHENIEFEYQRTKAFLEFQPEKGVNYSSIKNCSWTCHFVLGRKIPTSLLNKHKRMT